MKDKVLGMVLTGGGGNDETNFFGARAAGVDRDSSSSGAGLLAWKGGHLRSLLMGRPTPSRT
jgi:hypothetical protein